MKVILAVALSATALIMLPASRYSQEASAVPAGGLTEAIGEALYDDTGGHLCDQKLAAQAREGVEKRYGQRIRDLKAAYFKWHGADNPVNIIQIASCSELIRPINKEKYIRRSTESFGLAMTRLERQYADPPKKHLEP